MTAAAVLEEPLVSVPEPVEEELPPLPLTGDDETDEALALMRSTTGAIHDAQDRVAELSDERKRLVLDLRARGVRFRVIAQAAGSTEQTVLKIHREAKRDARERAEAAEAARLGYPTVEEYREALEAAYRHGADTVEAYVEPVEEREVPHPDGEAEPVEEPAPEV